jgi:hypothetical protein
MNPIVKTNKINKMTNNGIMLLLIILIIGIVTTSPLWSSNQLSIIIMLGNLMQQEMARRTIPNLSKMRLIPVMKVEEVWCISHRENILSVRCS